MDAITREAILNLTKRVADVEAALEAHRGLLREQAHAQALAAGTSFDPAVFDAQLNEAVLTQREKAALGVEEPVAAPVVLVLPDPTQTA